MPTPFSTAMLRACDEARIWLGATSPNPAVGAVGLDENGEFLAAAAHQGAGGAHAEAALLSLCRERNLLSRLHTICVTLEPCNHHGRTPPCTEAIIAAGVRRVIVGARDPNPHVKGGGCERLRQAGIEVIEDVENETCRRLIHAFAFHAATGKPFITIKRAFDAQGSMIPAPGQKTFTSAASLRLAHRLRKKADAIVTGSGTVLADNPLFTVRHVQDLPDKRRILAILDRRGRVPDAYLKAAVERGFTPLLYQDIETCLADLEKRGIRDILVESGPNLSDFMLNAGYWAIRVDIYKGEPDRGEVLVNESVQMPFDCRELDIETLLPL